MKHLKLFESFDNNEYYSEINIELGMDLIEDKCVSMNESTQTSILNFKFMSKNIEALKEKGDFESHTFVQSRVKNDYNYLDITLPDLGLNIEIVEIEDEWFIVRLHGGRQRSSVHAGSKTFKCDQFDGLVELFKDQNIIEK